MDNQIAISTSVSVAQLRALSLFAGDRDIRQYLNGVYFDPTGYAVATNGHILLAVRVPAFSFFDESGRTGFIVPNDALNLVLRKHSGKRELETSLYVDSEKVDGIEYRRIRDEFPEWQRIVPSKVSGEPRVIDADTGQVRVFDFSVEYLRTVEKAGELLGGSKCTRVTPNGNMAAVALVGDSAVMLVMPMTDGEMVDLADLAAQCRAFMLPLAPAAAEAAA